MDNLLLPTYGSVVIIDDQFEEALPLMLLLSNHGIPYTYYSGKDTELPVSPTQKIRIAMVDIQLFGPSDPHTYAQNILRILEKLIPENNGPFLLLIWSTVDRIYAETLESEVNSQEYSRKPLFTFKLEKSDYFDKVTENENDEIFSKISEVLDTRFSDDDIDFIKKTIASNSLPKQSIKAKQNALTLIRDKIKEQLVKTNCFSLFIIWENLINKSSGQTIFAFSNINEQGKHWDTNIKETLYKLAHAQVGKNVISLSDSEFVINFYKTINQYFLDLLESNTSKITSVPSYINLDKNEIGFCKDFNGKEYKIIWNGDTSEFQLKINNILMPLAAPNKNKDISKLRNWVNGEEDKLSIDSITATYLQRIPEINTKLLIDTNPSIKVQPGNVYYIEVRGKRKRNLLQNYLIKDKAHEDDANGIKIIDKISDILFVELEISPLCDFAQNKWHKHRYLSGILMPDKYVKYVAKPKPEYFYISPLFHLYNINYKLIFDYRLIKTEFVVNGNRNSPIFRLRNELRVDIIAKFSNHASRSGITYLE